MPAIAYLLCFVLGSVPFGFIVAKSMGVDILSEGSKNIGATNVGRVLGKGPAGVVLLLDIFKGFAPALIVRLFVHRPEWHVSVADHAAVGAGMAIFGHAFSPFLKFRGGKGVATGIGALAGTSLPVAGATLGTFIIIVGATRLVSAASLGATVGMMAYAVFSHQSKIFLAVFACVTILVWARHSQNINRLLRGEEKPFAFKKREPGLPEDKSNDEPVSEKE